MVTNLMNIHIACAFLTVFNFSTSLSIFSSMPVDVLHFDGDFFAFFRGGESFRLFVAFRGAFFALSLLRAVVFFSFSGIFSCSTLTGTSVTTVSVSVSPSVSPSFVVKSIEGGS